MSAALLAHDGYQNIRMRLKPAALHGKEIDVVGVKATPNGNECLIVETKGRATTDRELQAEIDDFSAKVRILQDKSDELAGELSYQGTLDAFRTRFISMADIEGSEHAEDAMEVWSFQVHTSNTGATLIRSTFPLIPSEPLQCSRRWMARMGSRPRSTTFNSGPPHYRGCALPRKGSPWKSDGRHRPTFSSFSRVTPNRTVMWLRTEACSSGSSDGFGEKSPS